MKSKSRNVVTSATSRMIYVAVYILIYNDSSIVNLSFYQNNSDSMKMTGLKKRDGGNLGSSLKQKRQTLNRK